MRGQKSFFGIFVNIVDFWGIWFVCLRGISNSTSQKTCELSETHTIYYTKSKASSTINLKFVKSLQIRLMKIYYRVGDSEFIIFYVNLDHFSKNAINECYVVFC